nr:MAG TPA: hypothetical protein [Caudoviricetes sp.]
MLMPSEIPLRKTAMYAMTIAASALGARLESHSFQPGFLLSFIFFTSLRLSAA